MPILWRYLLASFLRVFFLSVSSFAAILFVLRFKEIVRFAALSADAGKTGLFVLYQIPHILPIAIPVSSLIASFLLFQRLSQSYELTALRSLHFSLASVLTPLLLTSLFFACINLAICAELAPYCRRETKTILYSNTGINPLILLQRQQLARIKNTYLRLRLKQEGQSAKDFLCITYNEQNKRLNLINIKHLSLEGKNLCGKDAFILSHLPSDAKEKFDGAAFEYQKKFSTSAPLLSQILRRKRPATELSALSLKQLKVHTKKGCKEERLAWIEMLRRYSLSASVFSFTLLGCAFGIQIGRKSSAAPLLLMCSLAVFVLISYFLGKSLRALPFVAAAALLAPHAVLWFASISRLRSINRGAA